MKEFIDKLIEKIVNTPTNCLESYSISSPDIITGVKNGIEYGCASRQNEIIDIVNELAEEYKDNMEFEQKCVELAEKMNLCDLVAENVLLSHKIRFLELETKNNGWIACSERLPEQTEYFQTAEYTVTMRFVKNGKKSRPFTSHASFDFEAEKWLIKEYEVIAWREQIAPYTEGETELYRAKSVDGEYQEYKGDWK